MSRSVGLGTVNLARGPSAATRQSRGPSAGARKVWGKMAKNVKNMENHVLGFFMKNIVFQTYPVVRAVHMYVNV